MASHLFQFDREPPLSTNWVLGDFTQPASGTGTAWQYVKLFQNARFVFLGNGPTEQLAGFACVLELDEFLIQELGLPGAKPGDAYMALARIRPEHRQAPLIEH